MNAPCPSRSCPRSTYTPLPFPFPTKCDHSAARRVFVRTTPATATLQTAPTLSATQDMFGVHLYWTIPDQTTQSLELEISHNGDPFYLYSDSLSPADGHLDLTNLVAGDNYTFRITAVNSVSRSPSATASILIPAVTSGTLVPQDDRPSAEHVDIGFNINFYGVQTHFIAVNNNGFISLTPNGSWWAGPFSQMTQMIIAPYLGDVDTTLGGGSVTFGPATYDGHRAFVVDWNNVDYYDVTAPGHVSLTSSFSLYLVSRGDTGEGNFDLVFQYGQLSWDTGDAGGGLNGFLDPSYQGTPRIARAGYSNGTQTDGTYYELPGSGTPGRLLGLAGQTRTFQIHPGNLTFSIKDNDSGRSVKDSDDNPASPSKILGVAQNAGGPNILTLSLSGTLPDDAILSDFSWTAKDSSGSVIATDAFDSSGNAFLPVSTSGLYTVNVSSSRYPWFQRTIQFFVAKLKIVWNGADIADAGNHIVVHNGDDITNATVDYLAGQKISLRYEFDNSAGAIEKSKWNLGSLTNIVTGYTANTSIGQVSKLAASDFEAPAIAFFDVGNAPGQPFSVTLTWKFGAQIIAFSASTTFNIKKPGTGIWNSGYNFALTGQQAPVSIKEPDADIPNHRITDTFVWSSAIPASEESRLSYVQTISSYRSYLSFEGIAHNLHNTFGQFVLDTQYPYKAATKASSDDPWQPLSPLYKQIVFSDSFRLWEMWKAPGDSIEIPIQLITWSYTALAVQDFSSGAWTLYFAVPAIPAGTSSLNHSGVSTDQYPVWSSHWT